ncbi:hypothetical protein T4D_2072 [Trichinella pseudospiralis]|uniref:Uncharacterized protein n=1 Tax=Trichinella pseudospiralis TaxID=6337 RepID=A0A0V1FIW0_TRIPS|nr:hypothetical protein T4D_2072 [Trichinella pseudospiralis]
MVKVPSIVQNYNMHIGGVDLNNMLFGLYIASHKSRNWTKVTFFCVIAHGNDKRMAALSKKADIEKMYLQVGLPPEDQDVCRFIWQERGCEATVKVYRLTQVGFGLTCSPFLAMQVRLTDMERLIRVTAYCYLFLANVRTCEQKIRARLSLLELQSAENRGMRAIQAEAFPVLKIVSGPIPFLQTEDPLAALSPIVDTEGFLRPIVLRAHESELHAELNEPKLGSLAASLLDGSGPASSQEMHQSSHHLPKGTSFGRGTAAGKGRPSVLGGRRRSAEPLETGRDYRAVDGKRRVHKVSEGTDRPGPSHPVEQIADSSRASLGLVMNCGPSRGWEKTAKNHFCSSLTIRIRYRNQWLAVVVT